MISVSEHMSLRASGVPLYPASIHCTCRTKLHRVCGGSFVIVWGAGFGFVGDEGYVRLFGLDASRSCRRGGGFDLVVG